MEYDFILSPDDPPPIIGTKQLSKPIGKFTPKMFVTDVGKAYQDLGGLAWLIEQAKVAPQEFMKLLQKMMPKQIDLDLMEGTTIKLIDQFGQSIEVGGPSARPQPSPLPPPRTSQGEPLNPADSGEGGQIATGGSLTVRPSAEDAASVTVTIMDQFDD